MPVIVVIGGQWGDEGKGRIIDLLAQNANIVARYSAGNNAGHTVVNDMGTFRLHLVPAGIFYGDKICVIGNGVVIDPPVLLEEIEELQSKGVSVKNLYVSDRATSSCPTTSSSTAPTRSCAARRPSARRSAASGRRSSTRSGASASAWST